MLPPRPAPREPEETERFKAFDYADLIARDKANLDITWLRDPDAEDSDNLPPPEVIAQEIVDDLSSARTSPEVNNAVSTRSGESPAVGRPAS